MKYLLIIAFILTFYAKSVVGQKAKVTFPAPKVRIDSTIRGFLNWHKKETAGNSSYTEKDSIESFTKGGYPDTTTKESINWNRVEHYLNYLRTSGYFSDTYIDDLRRYFKQVADELDLRPKTNDLVAVHGLDSDWILRTSESDEILDNFNKGKLNKLVVFNDKAIARFRITKYTKLLFILTRSNDRWLIDHIGYDRTSN